MEEGEGRRSNGDPVIVIAIAYRTIAASTGFIGLHLVNKTQDAVDELNCVSIDGYDYV